MTEESKEEKEKREAADKIAAAQKEADEKIAADKLVKDELSKTKAAEAAAVLKKGGSPLQEAKETVKEMEKQNKIMADNIKKQEELQAEAMISGRTPAGQGSLSEEERKDADARKLIEGSGFEERLFPTPEEKAAAARK